MNSNRNRGQKTPGAHLTKGLEYNDDLYANEGQSKEDNMDEEDFYDDIDEAHKKSPGAAKKSPKNQSIKRKA